MNDVKNIERNDDITPEKEQGASLVEYALLVALIAVVAIAAISLLGTNVNNAFSRIASGVGQA